MTATTTVRRTSAGLDQLYVTSVDGVRLGWHDLASGATHLLAPAAGPAVATAVAQHIAAISPLRRRRVVTGLVRPQRGPSPLECLPEPEQTPDLREQGPGELAVRELLRRHEGPSPTVGPFRLGGRSPLTHATRRWYLAAVGQRYVGRLLGGLPVGWHVLHSVPLAPDGADPHHRADLHHLLIGPAGVLVVRTAYEPGAHVRCHGRTVRVSGRPADHVRAAERQAALVAERLSAAVGSPVAVRSVVAVATPRSLTVLACPRGVAVLDAARLVPWVRERPSVLSSVRVGRIARAAADPATWSAHDALEDGLDEGLDDQQRAQRRQDEVAQLETLRRQVRRASRSRSARSSGAGLAFGAVAVAAAVLGLVPLLPGLGHPTVQSVLAALP